MDPAGKTWRLYDLLAEAPVFLEFGAYTCGPTNRQAAGVQGIVDLYNLDLRTSLVIGYETHAMGPGCENGECFSDFSYRDDGSPVRQPETYEQRRELAEEFRDKYDATYPILVDEMDNRVKCDMALDTNTGYLIGVDGRVAVVHDWLDYQAMNTSIDAYLTQLWK